MSSQTSRRRLLNEAANITKEAEKDKTMFVIKQQDSDNMYKWTATINGPIDSLYDGYQFDLSIDIPADYPNKPLQIKFITKIEHVNVNSQGDICMDILKTQWTPAQNMRTILISLISLLSEPNPNDPLNHDLAELFRSDKKAYLNKIASACKKHARKIE